MAHPPQTRNARMRQLHQQGRTFYLAALVLTILLCYSYLRDYRRHGPQHEDALVARSLDAPNLECRLVKKAPDQCSFVKENCPDEEAGLISYLQFYYCSSSAIRPFAIVLIILWASLLFTSIGIAASDFLCINLSTIATILHMSESLTGVTFLAFGNGSPDVFSTFAAMKSNSGSLAVGELMGAAGFITAVVAGSMAIVNPFQVARKSFIRDVGFFAVSASFSLVFLADGSLRLWECAVMVAYYAFYVVFVTAWHWYLGRRRRKRVAETAARLHHHIPEHQELEAPNIDDDEESRPASERASLLRAHSGDSVPTLRTPGTPAWKLEDLDDDDEVRDRYLATLRNQMRVSRPTRGERRNTMTPIRPSLIGALEFRSIMSSLEKKGTNIPLGSRRYSEDASAVLSPAPYTAPPGASHPELATQSYIEAGRTLGTGNRLRAVSANDAAGLRLDTNFLSDQASETAISSQGSSSPQPATGSSRPSAAFLQTLNEPSSQRPPSPKLLLSPSDTQPSAENRALLSEHPKSPNLLAPPPTTFHRPDYTDEHRSHSKSPTLSPKAGPTLRVPILHTPHPDHSHAALRQEDFPPYVDSPNVLTPISSRPPSIHLPAPSMSPESTHHLGLLPDEEEEPMRTFSWWPYKYLPAPQTIVQNLFPNLYDWRKRSTGDRLLGIFTFAPLFLFRITLPVVEAKEEDDEPNLLTPGGDVTRGRSQSRIVLPPDTPALAAKPSTAETPLLLHNGGLSRQNSDFPKSPIEQIDEMSGGKDWDRWLLFVQTFTAPFFIVSVVWANMEEDPSIRLYVRMVLGSLVFSLIMLLILLSTTSPNREPKYRPMFCFLGFLVAIAWISTIANEVVGVLKAFGVITGMSDAILGLTIFAMGNSVGDWVADVTVAKLGYPVMALSACFGGPMLNILLGIGLGGMYMTIHNASHKHAKHPNKPIHYKPYTLEVSTTLMVSGITLLVTLVGLLIFVPLNGWRMDRKIGVGLIALWAISTTANVFVEIFSKDDSKPMGMLF